MIDEHSFPFADRLHSLRAPIRVLLDFVDRHSRIFQAANHGYSAEIVFRNYPVAGFVSPEKGQQTFLTSAGELPRCAQTSSVG